MRLHFNPTGLRSPRWGRVAGFSLLEVMISMAILVVALFALLFALTSSSATRRQARVSSAVGQLILDRMEYCKSVGSLDLVTELSAAVASGEVGDFTVTGTQEDFTITGTSAGQPTQLRSARVVTDILDEATASLEMAVDLDGDGDLSDIDPDDQYDLDGDLIKNESGFAADSASAGSFLEDYDVFPVRITVTWTDNDNQLRSQQGWSVVYPMGQ